MNTLLTLLFTLLAVPSSFRMMVVSDPHVLDKTLFDVKSQSMQALMTSDLKQNEYAQDAFNQLIDKALDIKPNAVLIPGNLTMNGERVSHEAVANQLRRLTEANIPVCLIPGNHDINNNYAASYIGATKQAVSSISSAEFDSLYAFTKAAFPNRRDDPNSHSYVVTLAPRLTLIGADCTIDSYTEESGVFTESTLNWILAQADSAAVKGDRIIAMMHYQLMEHTDGFGAVFPQGLVADYETIAQLFRAHGIELVLTGHMHIDNVSTNYMNGRDSLVEISTGTPIMYPSPYRMITFSGGRDQIDCTIDYITSLINNPVFSVDSNKNHVKYTIQNVTMPAIVEPYWKFWVTDENLYPAIDSLIQKGLEEPWSTIVKTLGGADAVKTIVRKLLAQVPSDPKGRTKFINSYVGEDLTQVTFVHLEGNEGDKDTKSLRKGIFDHVQSCANYLVNQAYPRKVLDYAMRELLLGVVSKVRSALDDNQQLQDALDGFFGDYTNYKKDSQNRTDDLFPSLRFAALPHRDYYATVYYDLNGFGQNFVDSTLINEPTTITRPADPKTEGWQFINWYTDEQLTQLYDFNTVIDTLEDVQFTLYAKWIPIITFTLGDVQKLYDGTPIEPLYKYKGSLSKSCSPRVEVDTLITNADSVIYHVTKTAIWKDTIDVTANYQIEWSKDSANMVITKRTIQITAASASKVYDGTALIAKDTTMAGDGFAAGEGIEITSTSSLTYVDTIANTITFQANDGTNLNNYVITIIPGQLIITPLEITLTSASASKEFDGTPLTKDSVTITGEFAQDEGLTVHATGSQTEVGTSDNFIEYAANEGTNLNNYQISLIYGLLEVTPKQEPTHLVDPATNEPIEKIWINNQLFIRKGDKLFNAQGQEL